MKKIILISLLSIATVSGMQHDIFLSRIGNNNAEIVCGRHTIKLILNESVKMRRIPVSITWNGDSFIISNSIQKHSAITSSDIFHFISQDAVLIFDSFSSPQAEIDAPATQFIGKSQINRLTVRSSIKDKLDISGSLTTDKLDVFGHIIVNGELNLSDQGIVKSHELTVNGHLLFLGDSVINVNSNVRNNGNIIGITNTVFQMNGRFENFGEMKFERFSLENIYCGRCSLAYFIQRGLFTVQKLASFHCDFENSGCTTIDRLLFPYTSNLRILGGATRINSISGQMKLIQAENESFSQIGMIFSDAKIIRSTNAKLQIDSLESNQKVIVSAEEGNIKIDEIKASDSTILSHDAEISLKKISGKTVIHSGGRSKTEISESAETEAIVTELAQLHIQDSHISDAYFLGKGSYSLKRSSAKRVLNHGKFRGDSTHINSFNNEGKARFSGKTTARKIQNNDTVTFYTGEHEVESYVGSEASAKLKVKGKKKTTEEIKQQRKTVILKDGDTEVSVHRMYGVGKIESKKQQYPKKLPTSFHTVGDVKVSLERMPKPTEIPMHDSGEFSIEIDFKQDFINSHNIDYGDVVFLLNMNGYKWENRNAEFLAGGLDIKNVSIFGNYDGVIKLQDFLKVHDGKIYNIATPIARENGRWIDDCSNWRARLIYYCPATYYLPNQETGIFVGRRGIFFDNTQDISNRFSIISTSGTFNARTRGKFDNVVAAIVAIGQGDSSITAEKGINNACLPAFLRKGEAHATGKSDWGFNKRRWYADSYTAEWITQSPSAMMKFGGNVSFNGCFTNFGSRIISNGLLTGDINSFHLFENMAEVFQEGAYLESSSIKLSDTSVFIYEEHIIGINK